MQCHNCARSRRRDQHEGPQRRDEVGKALTARLQCILGKLRSGGLEPGTLTAGAAAIDRTDLAEIDPGDDGTEDAGTLCRTRHNCRQRWGAQRTWLVRIAEGVAMSGAIDMMLTKPATLSRARCRKRKRVLSRIDLRDSRLMRPWTGARYVLYRCARPRFQSRVPQYDRP